MIFNKEILPAVQMDFTTIFGASLIFEGKEIKRGVTPSRILNLSQLVESIVLNSNIQFELGTSKDWTVYREGLLNTYLGKKLIDSNTIFKTNDEQLDSDESIIIEAIKWTIHNIYYVHLDSLRWAVSFRGGIYSGLPKINDSESPVTNKYLRIAKESLSNEELVLFQKALEYLNLNNIGILGVHVIIRIKLFEKLMQNRKNISYLPHYSRQPLLYSLTNLKSKEIHEWNMNLIKEKRLKLLTGIGNTIKEENFGGRLSPILVSCLYNAKHPLDIIENAFKFRESKEAKDYRSECNKLIQGSKRGDSLELNLYKISMKSRIEDLNEFLFSRGTSKSINTDWGGSFNFPLFFGWQKMFRTSQKLDENPGNRSYFFMSDILKHSLGILDAEKELNRIFKTNLKFDTNIFSISKLN